MVSRGTGGTGDDLERPLADGIVPETMVVRTERRWFWVVTSTLVLLVAVISVTAATDNLHPPSNDQVIDPAQVYQSPEFSEANLGTAIAADGTATVRMIAQQYSFVPQCVTVPQGAPVTFRLTSADVIHGFIVASSNVNTMVVPGYISDVTGTFPQAGTYRMPCHEFCGFGHAGMAAEVRVVPRDRFNGLKGTERMRCAAP